MGIKSTIPANRQTDLGCLFGIMIESFRHEIPMIQLCALALIASRPGITRGGISDELGADRGNDVARQLIMRRLILHVEPSPEFIKTGAGKHPDGLAATQSGINLIRSILREGANRARGVADADEIKALNGAEPHSA